MIFDELTLLLDPEPHGAALNMAIDEVLLQTVTGPLLRVYGWERPAVSFGYFGKVAEVERAWPGRELVRRWTGGGIVPHGEDVTYTLVVPRECTFFAQGPVESYRAIHAAVAAVMGAHLASEAATKRSETCFENAVRHDVMIGARKVAGAAQRRTQRGLLHQGSVQVWPAPADLAGRLASALSGRAEERALGREEERAGVALAMEKYATAAWLRRV